MIPKPNPCALKNKRLEVFYKEDSDLPQNSRWNRGLNIKLEKRQSNVEELAVVSYIQELRDVTRRLKDVDFKEMKSFGAWVLTRPQSVKPDELHLISTFVEGWGLFIPYMTVPHAYYALLSRGIGRVPFYNDGAWSCLLSSIKTCYWLNALEGRTWPSSTEQHITYF